MLAVVNVASQPILSPQNFYGKRHGYMFWVLDSFIAIVSDAPFVRGDLVRVQKTGDKAKFILTPVDRGSLSDEDLSRVGVLLPLITDVPLSLDVDYEPRVTAGDLDILTFFRTHRKTHAAYAALTLVRSLHAVLEIKDKVYGDRATWTFSMEEEFQNMVYPLQNGAGHDGWEAQCGR